MDDVELDDSELLDTHTAVVPVVAAELDTTEIAVQKSITRPEPLHTYDPVPAINHPKTRASVRHVRPKRNVRQPLTTITALVAGVCIGAISTAVLLTPYLHP